MRQTISSWRQQTGVGGMLAIAVCPDDSVGKNDDEVVDGGRYPCEVVRAPEEIATFITSRTGSGQTVPVVVFVTYRSDHLGVGDERMIRSRGLKTSTRTNQLTRQQSPLWIDV